MSAAAKAIFGTLLIVAVAGGAAWHFGAFDSQNLKQCEAMLIERLKVPSQYKRVEVREGTSVISEDEVWSRLLSQWDKTEFARERLAEIKASKNGYQQATIRISYDAPNTFGTMLRGNAICDQVIYTTKYDNAGTTELRFNGTTLKQRLDDLIKQIKSTQ